MVFLATLFALTSSAQSPSQHCPSYECEHPDVSLDGDTCVYYANSTFYLQVCDVGKYCLVTDGSQNSSCRWPPAVVSNPPPVYVGELCTYTNGCIYGSCESGLCRGALSNSACEINDQCDYGLYCSAGKCVPQLRVGSSGCTQDSDCVNSAGCNMTRTGSGTCTPYFSVPAYRPISSCTGNRSYLCESSYCLNQSSSFFCLPDLHSERIPNECTSDAACLSQETKIGQVQGNCTCGYNRNGVAYCDPFLGDSPGRGFLTQMQKWTNSKEILKCSTDRRFEYSCMVSHMKYEEMNEFGYHFNLATLYPAMQDMENCTWFVYFLTQQQIRYDFVSLAAAVSLNLLFLVT